MPVKHNYKPIEPGMRKRKKSVFARNMTTLVLVLLAAATCTVAVTFLVKANREGLFSGINTAKASSSQASQVSSGPENGLQPASSAQTADSSAISGVTAAPVSLAGAAKPVWISIDTSAQTLAVYDAKGKTIMKCICSTGLDGHDTPTGTYKVTDHGRKFFSKKYQEGGYYWLKFYGNYWIHSIVFDKNENIIKTEAEKLGTKASHGCVRIAIENAKWLFENIPIGTKVVIK